MSFIMVCTKCIFKERLKEVLAISIQQAFSSASVGNFKQMKLWMAANRNRNETANFVIILHVYKRKDIKESHFMAMLPWAGVAGKCILGGGNYINVFSKTEFKENVFIIL